MGLVGAAAVASLCGDPSLSLVQFHRFLIIVFVLFLGAFAWRLLTQWQARPSETWPLYAAGVAVVLAVGFLAYLRTVKSGRRPRRGG